MRTLTGSGVPNIQAPTTEFPYGRYKDKSSANTNDGTELSERTMGDTFQGLLNTVTRAGMTPNNEPESTTNSQIADAIELLKPVGTCVIGSDDGGTTFKVISSVIRDPDVTFGTGYIANTLDVGYLAANFYINRNGVLDTTRRYIVTATPAFDFSTASLLSLALSPRIVAAHSPYFNNTNISIGGLSNLFFLYPAEVPPSTAVTLARAVLTIYDAGPVA